MVRRQNLSECLNKSTDHAASSLSWARSEGASTTGQISFSDAEYAGKRKKTRREVFDAELDLRMSEATKGRGYGTDWLCCRALCTATHRCLWRLGHWLHWGATTQDVLLSVRAQQVNEAMEGVVGRVLAVTRRLTKLADKHRQDSMAVRAFGGHALPISFR